MRVIVTLLLLLSVAACGDDTSTVNAPTNGTSDHTQLDDKRRALLESIADSRVAPLNPDQNFQSLSIFTKTGEHPFRVELAITQAQKRQGLMYRRSLPHNAGMLFTYHQPARLSMWMKNTYVPLDMIFIHNGKIVHIAHNTTPQSLDIIQTPVPASAVLEVNAGVARKIGAAVGDSVVVGG